MQLVLHNIDIFSSIYDELLLGIFSIQRYAERFVFTVLAVNYYAETSYKNMPF